jgi:hypothetical protein
MRALALLLAAATIFEQTDSLEGQPVQYPHLAKIHDFEVVRS